MIRYWKPGLLLILIFLCSGLVGGADVLAAEKPTDDAKAFPRGLDSYNDADVDSISKILISRVKQEPFNLIATLIFLCAIIHTFLTGKFMIIAHKWEDAHEQKIKKGLVDKNSVHHGAELFHFLGEVEAVFGLWVIALLGAIFFFYDWHIAVNYIVRKVNFVEAEFVVVIMTLASTRPILKLTESIMQKVANLLGGSLTAWWFTLLTAGPILGSLITEPAAMTISALLLAHKFYDLEPIKTCVAGWIFFGGTCHSRRCPRLVDCTGSRQPGRNTAHVGCNHFNDF